MSLNLNEIIKNESYQISNFLEDLIRKSNLGKKYQEIDIFDYEKLINIDRKYIELVLMVLKSSICFLLKFN